MTTFSSPREILPGVTVGGGKLLLIAGPCQIESLEHSLELSSKIKEITSKFPVNLVFKASFDKANRTSLGGVRGIGFEAGLEVLRQIKESIKLPVTTDVHSIDQIPAVSAVVDILQTPAFLCRQTDLLIAVGQSGKPVNIKKGQFLHPEDMKYAAEKVASSGNKKILLCERGSSFGYRDLVVDMRSLVIMRELGYPVIFDATHSVQSMGGGGGKSTGARKYVEPLIRAATGVGVDGLFIECHENPDSAPSDGPNMLPLSDLARVLDTACKINQIR